MNRFEDERQSVEDFVREVLVVCPGCGACARAERTGVLAARLSCGGCGKLLERTQGPVRIYETEALDPYFDLPLWLQVGCCGNTLWAYNREHLRFLEAFVGARLRERVHDPTLGWSNAGLTSRLPKWLKAAKHREEILAALKVLAAKLPQP